MTKHEKYVVNDYFGTFSILKILMIMRLALICLTIVSSLSVAFELDSFFDEIDETFEILSSGVDIINGLELEQPLN